MASSDDEANDVLQTVSEYFFVNEAEEPVSFSVLPVQWCEDESINENPGKQQVFLNGKADNGLKKLYKRVRTWKFDLSNADLEIYVLTKDNCWIKLFKPRKSYEAIIRTILIALRCLHFVRRNPSTPERIVWNHLSRVFSLYDTRPSQDDLVDHMELMDEAIKRDASLAKSKFLLSFLEERPQRRRFSDEKFQDSGSDFIVDDVDDFPEYEEEDEECVCAFCDNGGDLLCCDGRCMRSFHATTEAGEESLCVSLGFTDGEVRAMENFCCKNCEYKQHQCFACGKLGNSDKTSGAEVFQCANAKCGYFYHPLCVAKLLKGDNITVEELSDSIIAGETFACPLHKCFICKQGENKRKLELQFAVCRRCPTAYHRKCLPREIAFDDLQDEGIVTRAWEHLLPNRILIYCLKHDIKVDIATPIRDHIVFPDGKDKQSREEKKKQPLEFSSKGDRILLKKRRHILGKACKPVCKPSKEFSPASERVKLASKRENKALEQNCLKKRRGNTDYKKRSREDMKYVLEEEDMSATANINEPNEPPLDGRLFERMLEKEVKHKNFLGSAGDKIINTSAKKFSAMSSLDADSERRLLVLMKEVNSSVSLGDIVKKLVIPSTHVYSSKSAIDKNITLGKVEGAVEAVKAALKKLDEGCSIEDAKAVCEPEVLNQVFRWKKKLKVHLAPFIHGMRYTSFGRHFTKEEKLQEVVSMLHWYVQEGDTIVDFCCGANDWNCLMKKKLEEQGKRCSYKNYDLFQPKNDFNFEKRDWMTVQPQELPNGDQLIMGLNPPFGVKAALANKFIDKALKFRPKLLILIVPPETERLDKNGQPYDLIWEDNQFLSGKSFYFPGSLDENDNQIDQWNVIAPALYLWSHRNWSAKHMAIAQEHGHPSSHLQMMNLEKDCRERVTNHRSREDLYQKVDSWAPISYIPMQNQLPESSKCPTIVDQVRKESSPCADGDRDQTNPGTGKTQSGETFWRRPSEGQYGRGISNLGTNLSTFHGRESSPCTDGDRDQTNPGTGKTQYSETFWRRPSEGQYGRGTSNLGTNLSTFHGRDTAGLAHKVDFMSFAPGPCNPSSRNSAGWLDE